MRLLDLSAILLMISGVTHIVQLLVYEKRYYTILPAIAGVVYLIIGFLLFFESIYTLWVGAIIPLLGGIGGIYRYVKIKKSNFIIFHVFIDIIVISSCLYTLFLLI